MKKIYFFIFIFICVLGTDCAVAGKNVQMPAVTLKISGLKALDIIEDIEKQSGYDVQIKGKLKNEIVSGSYSNVPIDQFFRRLFKHENVLIDTDCYEKKIIVYLFDSIIDKEYVKAVDKNDPDAKLALSNVTISELQSILDEENNIYNSWKNDPDAIVPFSSLTKNEFDEIVNKENEYYEAEKKDMERPVALSSLTQAELTSILESEGKEEQARRQDPNEKVALSNLTQSEFKAVLEEESRKIPINDPDAIIPFSNVTNREFRAMVQ